ncbi:MAG: aminotransferase class I/II-fold pyridoxal phosphate-dependent enzyme [Candidatus Magnetomorum sp.]|nr:aminotransferase class I/II-fold pyridoxal phosphate-dependent enzyme [Candidatus Magnetomorum sp.]
MQLTAESMNTLVTAAMKYISDAHLEPDQWPLAGSGVNWISQAPSTEETNAALNLIEQINEPLPEDACQDVDQLFQLIFEKLAPVSTNDNSPGYLAYIPGGGLFHACLAEFISLCLNRYVTIFMSAPGLAAIENQAIRWFCDIIGYSERSGGVLTSGGSLATIYALHLARSCHFSHDPDQALNGRVYASNQTHCCLNQAMQLCGFSDKHLQQIDCHPSNYRICINTLRQSIENDQKNGTQPFMLIANAGTTNTGAVDDLSVMADIAKDYGLWFHVDAAYGGFFMLTDHGKGIMKGIERADSVCVDPHKSLFFPYGTGALLVKDQKKLLSVFKNKGTYLPEHVDSVLPDDIMNISPEMTREFRGLRVWLPIKMLGIKAFRDQLEEKILLAQWVCKEIEQIDPVIIVAKPQLSTFVFKIQTTDSGKLLDDINRCFINEINKQGRILLSPFRGNGQVGEFGIRMSILSFRTDKKRLEQGIEDIRRAAEKVLKGALINKKF